MIKKFDKQVKEQIIYTAIDCQGDPLSVGDIVIGAYGTGQGYIFKGEILEIFKELIRVRDIWQEARFGVSKYTVFKVAPKRVRGLKYEKI